MNINRRRFLTIAVGATVAATTASATTAPAFSNPVTWRGVVLGAEAKLVITGMSQEKAEHLIWLTIKEANRLENIFSLYRKQSALSRLNKFGALENPPLEMLTLLSTVDQIHEASNGYFDPTIQPLWESYAEYSGHPPSKIVEQKKKLIGWKNVKFSSLSVRYEKQDMAMTLNGIAQGFITDRIVQLLKREGLQNSVVKMGEISTLGHNETGEAWEIGIANSGDEVGEEIIKLRDQSIATSSIDGTTFDGKIGHILNPQGERMQNQWQRISVIHKSATIADGISTAAVLMNKEQIINMLGKIKDAQLIAKYHNGDGYTHQS